MDIYDAKKKGSKTLIEKIKEFDQQNLNRHLTRLKRKLTKDGN
jgi:hypothetical protein